MYVSFNLVNCRVLNGVSNGAFGAEVKSKLV